MQKYPSPPHSAWQTHSTPLVVEASLVPVVPGGGPQSPSTQRRPSTLELEIDETLLEANLAQTPAERERSSLVGRRAHCLRDAHDDARGFGGARRRAAADAGNREVISMDGMRTGASRLAPSRAGLVDRSSRPARDARPAYVPRGGERSEG